MEAVRHGRCVASEQGGDQSPVAATDGRIHRLLTNYRVGFAATGAAALGLAFLWGGAQTSGVTASFLGGLGATVLSIGLVVLVYELSAATIPCYRIPRCDPSRI